jgi:hypothetical protein
MGYRGKVTEQEQARLLRGQSWTLQDIADELDVSKSSVSVWVRDVEFVPSPRRTARRRGPNRLQVAKQAEIESLLAEGRRRVGRLSEREFLVAGAALYAGEGSKRDREVGFANSDPRMILFFLAWLRHFFGIDEERLRLRLYLHEDLDLDAAIRFWSSMTNIPRTQFQRAYRAVSDPSIRKSKHVYGCPSIRYASASTHRAVMGVVQALLSSAFDFPG